MAILDQIIADKRIDVNRQKELLPLSALEKNLVINRCRSLKEKLFSADRPEIIAEIKKKSPSRGVINSQVSVKSVASGYQDAGAAAISVLTDHKYFSGSNSDLVEARNCVELPILRKDFIVDEYQIFEAKQIGADLILLIARVLDPVQTARFARLAKTLSLEVLLEVHSGQELQEHLNDDIDIVGVNNRDLDTLSINIDLSHRLIESIPTHAARISESGLSDAKTVLELHSVGYQGFLMGESFMKTDNPAKACRELIKELH